MPINFCVSKFIAFYELKQNKIRKSTNKTFHIKRDFVKNCLKIEIVDIPTNDTAFQSSKNRN